MTTRREPPLSSTAWRTPLRHEPQTQRSGREDQAQTHQTQKHHRQRSHPPPEARASILWLLGQHARQTITTSDSNLPALPQRSRTLAELILPDILRRCALNFTNESAIVKLQILTTSSKVFSFLPTVLVPTVGLEEGKEGKAERLMSSVTVLHFYLLKLARYDAEFDVRDRARFLKGLTGPLTRQKGPVSGGNTAEDGAVSAGAAPNSIEAAIQNAARTIGETTSSEEDADLKGVRLRREQVVHVLFEGKSTSSDNDDASKDSTSKSEVESINEGPELASLSLVLGGKLIKGWLDTKLPPWTDTPTSSDLREPPAVTSTPSHPSLQGTTLSNLKSFSSSDFAQSPSSSGPIVLTPGRGTSSPLSRAQSANASGVATPIDLEGNGTSGKEQQKYKDLDSFLDESDDEVEQEMDDSAPEDDDFRAQNEWDDEEEDQEEEEDADDDDDDDDDEEEEEEDEEDESD